MIAPILYVDDEPGNLVIFRRGLEPELPVVAVRTAEEALACLERQEFSVLLADQRMPGLSGVDLVERARDLRPDTIRMLVTAYSDLDAAIDAINRGRVQRYLRKPWELLELRATLREARERYLLGRRVRELEARIQGTERVYALGVAAAGIAHELRNPLGTIRVANELSRRSVAELLTRLEPPALEPGELQEELGELAVWLADQDRATDSIVEILQGIELSTRSREEGPVALGEVVALTMRLVRAEERRVGRLVAELSEVAPVRGSRTRLGQLVLNLLLNAFEALDPARADRNVVRLSLREEGGGVLLEIADNGLGMSEETAARAFEPFFTTKPNGGTGLGLAICRRIVEEHGGRLELRSQPGEGTTFVVRLPASAARSDGGP